MVFHRSLTVCGAALLGLILSASGEATTTNRLTYLTFARPVALPGAQLMPGTYIFEFADPLDAPGVVRVSSRDRSKVYLLAFTNRVPRPDGMRLDRPIAFGEAPAGSAPPIAAWFPYGEAQGRQFIYR